MNAGLFISHSFFAICHDSSPGTVTIMLILSLLKSSFYGGLVLLTKNMITEIVPTKLRGSSLNFVHVTWQFGGVAATLMSYMSTDYRALCLLTASPGLPLLFMVYFHLPESPRWLLQTHGTEAAQQALAAMAKASGTASPLNARVLVESLSAENSVVGGVAGVEGPREQAFGEEEETSEEARLGEDPTSERGTGASARKSPKGLLEVIRELTSPSLLRLTMTLFAMWLAIEYASNGMDPWILAFLKKRGKEHLKRPISFVQFSSKMVGGLAATCLVDHLGRRKLLSISFSFSGLATLAFASASSDWLLYIAVMCIYTNTEVVWSTITTYTSEVYPTQIRNSAVGIIHGISVSGAVVNVAFTPVLMDLAVELPFLLNGAIFIMGAVITFLLSIETKGRPLS